MKLHTHHLAWLKCITNASVLVNSLYYVSFGLAKSLVSHGLVNFFPYALFTVNWLKYRLVNKVG